MGWERPTGWDDYLELSEKRAIVQCFKDYGSLSVGLATILRAAGWESTDDVLEGSFITTNDTFETRDGGIYRPKDDRYGSMLMVGLGLQFWSFSSSGLSIVSSPISIANSLTHRETSNV